MKKYLSYILMFLFSFLIIFNVSAEELSNITSRNVLFINADKDEVIYEKASNDKVLIASLTKIMTALVGIENIDNIDEKIVITNDMIKDIEIDYTKVGFKVGDTVTYKDVLYGILLKSGADATNIIAISTSSTIDNFVEKMNQKAKELKMRDTHFTNTIGKDNENHYSTAKDLLILLKYAYKNDTFREIFTTENYITTDSKYNISGPLKYLHNDDFKMDYVKGAKTGYTKAAGHCLASVAKNKKDEFLLVTIGNDSQDKTAYFIDSKNIYDYYFNNYDYKKILNKKDTIVKLKTQYDEKIVIKSKESVTKYIDKSLSKDDLTYEFDGKKVLKKGIKKNDKIGTFYIKDKDKILYEKIIRSPKTVRMTFNYFINHNKIELILLFILTILLIVSMNKLIKNRKNKYR